MTIYQTITFNQFRTGLKHIYPIIIGHRTASRISTCGSDLIIEKALYLKRDITVFGAMILKRGTPPKPCTSVDLCVELPPEYMEGQGEKEYDFCGIVIRV
jgi:hypothetical protein